MPAHDRDDRLPLTAEELAKAPALLDAFDSDANMGATVLLCEPSGVMLRRLARAALALAEQHAALLALVRWAMEEVWEHGADVDADGFQSRAAALGILREETYDPERHGPADAEPGARWYVLALEEVPGTLAAEVERLRAGYERRGKEIEALGAKCMEHAEARGVPPLDGYRELGAKRAAAEREVERLRAGALTEDDIKACARRFAVDGMGAEAAIALTLRETQRKLAAAEQRAAEAERERDVLRAGVAADDKIRVPLAMLEEIGEDMFGTTFIANAYGLWSQAKLALRIPALRADLARVKGELDALQQLRTRPVDVQQTDSEGRAGAGEGPRGEGT